MVKLIFVSELKPVLSLALLFIPSARDTHPEVPFSTPLDNIRLAGTM